MKELLWMGVGALAAGLGGLAALGAAAPARPPAMTSPERQAAVLVYADLKATEKELFDERLRNAALRVELDAARRRGADVQFPAGVVVGAADRIPAQTLPVPTRWGGK